MHVIDVLGRIFLSTLFLIEGTNKIINYEGTIQYMENFGVSEYLAVPAIILEILFPLLLIIGYQTKIASSDFFFKESNVVLSISSIGNVV